MRVAFYTRISTDEDHQKYSLDAQRDRLDAYCKSQYDEYDVVKVYRDASTGTNMNRPGLEEMLYDAENKRFEVLIVFRVDRLSRNVRQLAQMVESLTECGVVLRSSTEPFDTSNSAGKMMLQMLGVFAEFEHATIVERTKAGMERKARNGEWCGGYVPYGYQKVDSLIVIDEEEAPIIRRIFRDYVYGRKGATKIYKELNASGLRKRSGVMWDNRAVIIILKNPFYTGMIRWKESVFKGKHEGIISQEMFDKAQAIFEKRNTESRGQRFKKASDFFLTGLVFCGKCGKGLVGRAAHRNGHRHKYYACPTRSYHCGCDLPFIRADIVEVLAVKEIQSIFRNPELLEKVREMVNEGLAKERPDKARELEKVDKEIERTKSALDRYFAAFEAGTLKPEVLNDKIEEFSLRLQQLEEEKSTLEGDIEGMSLSEIDQEGIKVYVDALEAVLENGGNEQKKHLLRTLVEKVLVHDKDRYEFTFRLPDGSTLQHALETIPEDEANSLSDNHLASTVCNQDSAAPRTVVIANRRVPALLIATQTVKDRKTRKYKFTREKLKIGLRKPFSRRPRWMGGIDDGVSHFLCPDHSFWLPSQRYELTLAEKRQARKKLATEWREGLANGTYENRADIARKNGCSRAWVTRLLNRELSVAKA